MIEQSDIDLQILKYQTQYTKSVQQCIIYALQIKCH